MIEIPCCRDLARLVATDELAGAPRWRRLCARIHLLLCRPCRTYRAQILAIGRLARERYAADDAQPKADELVALLKKE